MNNILILCAGFVVSAFTKCDAARILAVFPTPSISHQVVFRPLTQELAKRGHQVVVITPDPVFIKSQSPANLTEIDVHDLSYGIWSDFHKTTSGKQDDLFKQLITILDLLTVIVEKQFQTPAVQDVIKNQSFDLLLLEACVRSDLLYAHIFDVPVILVSSFGAMLDSYDTLGAPTHPLLYPVITRQRIYNLTDWEKIKELYNHYKFKHYYYSHEEVDNEMIRRILGPEVPTLTELSKKTDMLFLNVHPVWEGNIPVPPTVINMWGIHEKPRKDLPNDIKSYLDSSKYGVIYISFGTNVSPSILPKQKIEILVKVFSQMPYDVLWKWDKDELPGRSKNIRIAKWLPQSDLLYHPKIKLFITQGGLQSTDEAITAGIPLIGIPMLGDQWYNVEKYLYHKIGLRLDMETLTEEQFKKSINTVIEDKSYRQNIMKLRDLMKDQQQPPLERAVWWTEYVLRHGGAKHLQSPAANISWVQYFELQLITILGLILSLTLIAFVFLCNLIWKLVRENFVDSLKKKN